MVFKRHRGKKAKARECTGKKVYFTQPEAVVVAKTLQSKTGSKFNVYQCRFCYGPAGARNWHVGHKTPFFRRLGQ